MKHNSVWGKLLLLALSFVLAFSTLVSCTKDDIAALDKENDEIKTELGTTEENLAKLQTLVNSIKVTADAAATKAALDEAVAALEAVKGTADAAVTEAKLTEVKTALEAALATADTAVKTELQTAIDAVKATADAAVTEAKLTEVKTALQTAIDGKATAAALEAAVAQIESLEENGATDAELATVKTALETAIAGKATAAEITAAVAKVEEKLADYAKAADVTALQTALNDTKKKVEDTAKSLSDLLADYEALKASINGEEGLAAQLAVVQKALETLKTDSNKFAEEYELATKVLWGEYVVIEKDGNYVAVDPKTLEEGTEYKVYSLDAFTALKNSVLFVDESQGIDNTKYYAPSVVKAFEDEAKKQEFFLGRAISLEAIVNCFASLEETKAGLETLVETLERYLYDCDLVLTVKEDCIDYIHEVVDRIVDNQVDMDDELAEKLEKRYFLLCEAHENLMDAEDASEAIEKEIRAADAVVIYRDKTVMTPVHMYDQFKDTYFTNLSYFVFYGDASVTAEDLASALVKNYDVMRKHEARLYELDAAGVAANTLEAGFTSAQWYDGERPLYTVSADLAADVDAFKKWIANYKLENANVEAIVGDKYEVLVYASDYATAMNNIWTSFEEKGVKVAILDAIAALKGAEDASKTLITEETTITAIRTLITKLDAEIKAVSVIKTEPDATEWTTKDGNFAKMVGDLANFIAIENRLAELNDADDALDAIYGEMNAVLGNVTFKNSYDIKAWEAEIADIYASVGVEMKDTDANFVEIEKDKPTTKMLADLKAEYEDLVIAIRSMYEEITTALGEDDASKMSLTLGLRLGAYNALLDTIPTDTVDINLNLDDDENKVTLADLTRKLAEANTAYKKYAADAQTAAKAVIDMIIADAYVALTTDTLNNYAEIVAVREALDEWLETYILNTKYAVKFDDKGIPTEYETVSSLKDAVAVKAALAAIADVPVAGTAGAQKYEFVTVDNYSYCVDKYDAIVAFRKLADADWAELEKQFGPLTDSATQTPSKDIHNLAKYEDVNFFTYINTYYGEIDDMANLATVVTSAVNDEINAYNAFKNSWDACVANDNAAGIKRDKIHNYIAALPAPNASNYATVLADIVTIRDLIETYYENYCPTECSDCITDADLLLLEKRAAVAEVVKYAEEVVRVNANADTNEKINGTVGYWTDRINDYTNSDVDAAIDKIIDFIGQAKEQFKLDYPCLVDATADHTYGDDCVCNFCDNVRPCVDAPKDGDHKCDNCGKANITVCADAEGDDDHKCDDCGAADITSCADVDDEDHKCDECGELMAGATCEDADADGNHNCDECGEPMENAACADTDADGKCDECNADVPAAA